MREHLLLVWRKPATRLAFCLFAAAGLALFFGPALAGRGLSNLGMVAFTRGLARSGALVEQPAPARLVPFPSLAQQYSAEPAMLLRRAATLSPGDSTIRWELGRLALAGGDWEHAADVLAQIAGQARLNPLLYNDALTAFSYANRYDQVIDLYESTSVPGKKPVDREKAAIAYLKRGQPADLDSARRLKPEGLLANYYLYLAAQREGNALAAGTYRDALTRFSGFAIAPGDARLIDYLMEAVPSLLADGLWDREKAVNVVSYAVWQYNEAVSVELMLQQLARQEIQSPDWPFYLAEMYQRRGDLSNAEQRYEQVLAIDPSYSQPYLRLGSVLEAKTAAGSVEESLRWYDHYQALAPDDLLGLRRLAEIHLRLNSPEAAAWQGKLAAQTDDRLVVARLLEVHPEAVQLGPNLVANSGLEVRKGKRAQAWGWNSQTGREFNEGLFLGGLDDFAGWHDTSARMIGFWIDSSSAKAPGWGQFWQLDESLLGSRFLRVAGGASYFISFYYQTSSDVPDQKVSTWVSGKQGVVLLRRLTLAVHTRQLETFRDRGA